jgi:putative Holliday junction resolvase
VTRSALENQAYSRVVAIDYGTKRVGIAKSDPFRLFAQPVGTFAENDALLELKRLIETDGVTELVLGYPLHADGTKSHTTKAVDAFAHRLQKAFPNIPLAKLDEHNSSKEAMQALIASGVRKKRRGEKGELDKAAACVILQRYLDGLR